VAQDPNHAATQAEVKALQDRFSQNPWLHDKIEQLRYMAN
jgi:hypothetical protein